MRIGQAQIASVTVSLFILFTLWGWADLAGTPGKHSSVSPELPKSPTKPVANTTRWELKMRSALSLTWNACKEFWTTSTTSCFRPFRARKMGCSESVFQPKWRTPISELPITYGSPGDNKFLLYCVGFPGAL